MTKTEKRSALHNSWILKKMWIFIDEGVSVRRVTRRCHMRVGWLGQAIWAALKGDRRRRVETMGKYMAWILNGDSPLPLKAWRRMQGWHRAAVEHTPHPDQITLNHITADRVELYFTIPLLPPGGVTPPCP